jgi:adenosine deaminase
VKLCVFKTMQEHNLATLLHAGLCITLNSDDPAYFGGYLLTNFEAVFAALPELGARDAWQLARNSVDASFAPEGDKAAWRAQLDAVFDALLV